MEEKRIKEQVIQVFNPTHFPHHPSNVGAGVCAPFFPKKPKAFQHRDYPQGEEAMCEYANAHIEDAIQDLLHHSIEEKKKADLEWAKEQEEKQETLSEGSAGSMSSGVLL